MRKLWAILIAFALLLSLVAVGASAESVPMEGAKFAKITNVGGIDGSSFYLYVASELYDPYPMLTPVIYVFGDEPYQNAEAAWAAAAEAGLIDIAEADHGAVILVNPVGESWGSTDLDVFEAIEQYIYYTTGTVKLTYHNLQYAIGEGTGATFINDYLTQDCKRLAAVMTFGGEIHNPYPLYPLPAYIVTGSQKAIDFYKNINDGTLLLPTSGRITELTATVKKLWSTEATDQKTVYTFTPDPVKKVIVSNAITQTLDADIIADCWATLFRRTTRSCLTTNCWQFSDSIYNDTVFTLLERPDYTKAGMQVVKVEGVGNGIWDDSAANYWYEFVSAAVQEAMSSGSDEKFPLVLCIHGGGDHPIYETESMGWAQLAIDQNVIVVSPNAAGADQFVQLIDYMAAKYPVDLSRVYVTGFSRGARQTLAVSHAYPERFAASAPISCVSGPFFTDLIAALPNYAYDLDLPICFGGQGMETESTNNDNQYVWFEAVKEIYAIDEITPYEGDLDYTKYPYWGFPVEDNQRNATPSGHAIWQGYLYDADGIPLVCAMHTEDLTHAHFPSYAQYIWGYFSMFSRDTATGALIYEPAQ